MSFCERGAKDNPWMESFWGRFKVENGSLFGDAATLGELEWAIGRQMKYHNHERRHSRLGYRSPMEYLASEGFVPKTLAEIGSKSGSVPGAHIQERCSTWLRRCCLSGMGDKRQASVFPRACLYNFTCDL